jgi:hypothetical protein
MKSVMRIIIVGASVSFLLGCGTPSTPHPDVAPLHLSADLCAKPLSEPVRPASASFERPTTDATRGATRAFLAWIKDTLDWGRGLQARAEKTAASDACHG